MTHSVFLVEDDPILRKQLTELINHSAGAHVVATADTEYAATEWLTTHAEECQLLVLDLFLKHGTGPMGVRVEMALRLDHHQAKPARPNRSGDFWSGLGSRSRRYRPTCGSVPGSMAQLPGRVISVAV